MPEEFQNKIIDAIVKKDETIFSDRADYLIRQIVMLGGREELVSKLRDISDLPEAEFIGILEDMKDRYQMGGQSATGIADL